MPKMTGARLFAQMMEGYGVTHIFFVPAFMLKAFAEMEDMPIKRLMVHGEKAAAYMADGYARASGKPGVCMAQMIGASNLAAGIRDAHMAGAPVIAITGGPTPQSRYRHAYQEVDDVSQFDAVTKFNAQVDIVTRLPDLLRQAFRVATSGAPGPVHLRIQSHLGQITEEEAELDPLVETMYQRAPAFRPEPEMQRVRDALAVLAAAKRPVIVAGGGVVRSGAQAEAVELAEKLRIPVATSLNAKAAILDAHPLAVGVPGAYSRDCANRVLHEADLVFFIGSHCGGQVTNNWMFPPPGTKVIQLDIDPTELGRNYPNAVSILGDAKVSLRRMIDAAPHAASEWGDWIGRVQQIVADWRAENAAMRNSDAMPIRPERICREISEVLPADGVVVSDTGHAGIWSARFIELQHPGQGYYRTAGSLGWGFPAALGVKCALPDRPVVCFTGDGGFYYHIAELETARRHNINAVIVVNNNSALNQEINLNNAAYGGEQRGRAEEMWRFPNINFAKVAESFGCVGIRVEKPGDMHDALRRAIAMNRPVVVDVVSDMYAIAPHPWTATGRDFHSYQKTGA
ncbi:MAG: thiamine pyrophosphate-binding protein [Betaproteobacteria bacterium]|nr:thiamine pyrophosphate-binding protein [Betaproteobacteria bacterium]